MNDYLNNSVILQPIESDLKKYGFTGRSLLDTAFMKAKYKIGSIVDMEEDISLLMLNDIIFDFLNLSRDNTGWRFMRKTETIKMKAGVDKYNLPDGLSAFINVYLMSDCPITSGRPLALFQSDILQNDNQAHYNSYSTDHEKIRINNLELHGKLKDCNHCGVCNYCNKFQGHIKIEYFSGPKEICSLDTLITYIPNEICIKRYLIEKLIEATVSHFNQMYQSEVLPSLYRAIVQYDEKLFTPEKRTNMSTILNFRNIYK